MSGAEVPIDTVTVPAGKAGGLKDRLRKFKLRGRDAQSPDGQKKSAARSVLRSRFGLAVALIMLLMLVVFLIPLSIVFIGPGSGGVLWSRFGGGTQFQPALGEGFHIIWPWNRIYIYNLQLQTWNDDLYALTSDGLSLSVEVSARYRLSPENLAFLQNSVGPDYVAKIITPQVGAVVRKLIALYPMDSLLGPLRNQIQEIVFKTLTDRSHLNEIGAIDAETGADAGPLFVKGAAPTPLQASVGGHVNIGINTLNRPLILLQDLLISRIVMPEPVREAINAKLQEAERAQEYSYTLDAQRDETERQALQAEGIRRFEDTVGGGLTQSYLTLRGIEATEALAKSPNTKVIVIGGNQGLPLILNTGSLEAAASKPAPNGAPSTSPQTSGMPSSSLVNAAKPVALPPAASPPQAPAQTSPGGGH
jgi:prohibitin 2